MPKGYFISAHRSTADPEKRAAYLKLAGPAIEKYNGKILASTNKIKVFDGEGGTSEFQNCLGEATGHRMLLCIIACRSRASSQSFYNTYVYIIVSL